MSDTDTQKVMYVVDDLKKIVQWLEEKRAAGETFHTVTIHSTVTGIGTALTAYIDTKSGEGFWKDFTDYSNW